MADPTVSPSRSAIPPPDRHVRAASVRQTHVLSHWTLQIRVFRRPVAAATLGGDYSSVDFSRLNHNAGVGLTGDVDSNGPQLPVSDGGFTIVLLGGALFGLEAVRRSVLGTMRR